MHQDPLLVHIIKPTCCQNPGRVFPLDASASIPVLVLNLKLKLPKAVTLNYITAQSYFIFRQSTDSLAGTRIDVFMRLSPPQQRISCHDHQPPLLQIMARFLIKYLVSPIGQIIRTQHGSDNGLWPGLCQAITLTSDDQAHRLQVLSVGTGSNKAGKLQKKVLLSDAPLWFAIRSVDQRASYLHFPTYLYKHIAIQS